MSDNDKVSNIAQEAREFMQGFQSITLATSDAQGKPEASYATFVQIGNKFYVYVSELAVHCANLQQSPRCSAMFIENEEAAKTVFARRRFTLQCSAVEISREAALFNTAMDAFRTKFGKFMDMIAPLTDFHLYELTPSLGSYVSGFAKAYHLVGEDFSSVAHRNDEGHKTQDNASGQPALA
jgi:hypothetical protein